MATKTLTITEEAYNMLSKNKIEGESFSEEIKRILSKKRSKKLIDFFGIISKDDGKKMLDDLSRIKSENINLLSRRLK